MTIHFTNQWRSPRGNRDITWLGIESSSFTYGRRERNIHVFVCGLGLVWWYYRQPLDTRSQL